MKKILVVIVKIGSLKTILLNYIFENTKFNFLGKMFCYNFFRIAFHFPDALKELAREPLSVFAEKAGLEYIATKVKTRLGGLDLSRYGLDRDFWS